MSAYLVQNTLKLVRMRREHDNGRNRAFSDNIRGCPFFRFRFPKNMKNNNFNPAFHADAQFIRGGNPVKCQNENLG